MKFKDIVTVAEAANPAQQAAIAIAKKKKKSVAESSQRVDSLVTDALKLMRGPEVRDAVSALKTVLGDREYNQRRGHYNFYIRQMLDMYGQQGVTEGKDIDARISNLKDAIRSETPRSVPGEDHREQYARHAEKIAGYKAELKKLMAQKKQGVAEGQEDRRRFIRHNIWTAMDSDEEVLQHAVEGDPFYSAKKFMRDLDDQGYDFTHVISPEGEITYSPQHDPRHLKNFPDQGVAEDYDSGEYNDEAGMADNNLETLKRAVQGIDDLIQSGDNLPEWCQEKIAVAKSMLVAVWDYMESEENSEEVDPEIDAMFEALEELVLEMAHKKQIDAELVWERIESLPDQVLYETAAWRRKEGKNKKGGLNAKGVASYRREHPGSKLQTAVTTKPSKLKPGSKAAKRRKSFCARMSGVKGPMKKPNGKPTRKALALRKWNC